MANCEVVETTISVSNTLPTASATNIHRQAGVVRSHATANPMHNNGIHAPAYRGPNDSPAFHQ